MSGAGQSNNERVPKGPSWADVRDMFAELGLPICDDGARIDAAFEARRKKYVIDANKPGSVGDTARENMKNGQSLKKDSSRQSLLAIVFEGLAAALKANLETQASQGLEKVEPSVVQAWQRQFAEKMFGCDSTLSNRFVGDWMKQEGLSAGGRAAPLPTVGDFQARAELRRVRLSWKRPSVPFDRVVVTRDGKPEPIYSGADENCADNDIVPGQTYLYRLHAERFREKGPPVTVKITCLGEVSSPSVRLEKGKIRLEWRLPFASARVAVFRRAGERPNLRRGGAGWEPGDNSTACALPAGGHSRYEEQAAEGSTVYFQIVVTDGLDNWTDGVVLQIAVPKPPPSPSGKLDARYLFDNGANIVTLSWPAAGANPEYRYVVVRREGVVAPMNPGEGDRSEELAATTWKDDLKVPLHPGNSYVYSVFTVHNGTFSHSGLPSAPVEILSEVTSVDAKVTKTEIKLIWQAPKFVKSILVTRTPPGNVRVDGSGQAVDSEIEEGARYTYRIHCYYQVGGRVVRSLGTTLAVEAGGPPEGIRNFSRATSPDRIEFSWDPVARGSVRVWKGPARPAIREGEVFTMKQRDQKLLDWHGEEIRVGTSHAVDDAPGDDMRFYIPFIDTGSTCVAGPVLECAFCPGITNPQFLEVVDGSLVLSWNWPESKNHDCKSALVLIRPDTWPQGEGDAEARAIVETRSEYDRRGGRFKIAVPKNHPVAYIVILPMRHTPGGAKVLASIADPGCRLGPIRCGPPIVVEYKVKQAFLNRRCAAVEINISNLRTDFSGLRLVAAPPFDSSPDRWIEVSDWSPRVGVRANLQIREKIDLKAILEKLPKCRLHLELKNPGESTVVTILPEPNPATFTL